VIDILAVDGQGVTFGNCSEEGPGRAAAPLSPRIAVPNVTAHPSTASVLFDAVLQLPKGLISQMSMVMAGQQACSRRDNRLSRSSEFTAGQACRHQRCTSSSNHEVMTNND